MELQVDKKEHLRHLILLEFNRGTNGTNAARNLLVKPSPYTAQMFRVVSAPFEPR